MRVLLFATLIAAAFALQAAKVAEAEPAVCDPAMISQVSQSRDLAKLVRTYEEADACRSREPHYCLARLIASAFAAKAKQAAATGATPSEVSSILDEAFRKFGKPWRLYESKGDLEMALGKKGDPAAYSEASRAYEKAINDLADDNSKCAPYGEAQNTSNDEIALLHKHMEQAKLLSPTFELIKTRDGECGGVFLTKVRGFEPKSTPLPIEFDYNATSLTPKGQQALKALSECVGRRNFKRIHLTGHTDMKGSDEFNRSLSARRLDVVHNTLAASGFHGSIVLDPKGKSEPFPVDDPSQHSQSEIDQMNRRVELRDAAE